MQKTVKKAELLEAAGRELGPGSWFLIDQERVDRFADATLDHQFIHVDPERAAATPLGGTVAHGFLTLSLVPHLAEEISVVPEGVRMAFNYGLNQVRFLQPRDRGQRGAAALEGRGGEGEEPGEDPAHLAGDGGDPGTAEAGPGGRDLGPLRGRLDRGRLTWWEESHDRTIRRQSRHRHRSRPRSGTEPCPGACRSGRQGGGQRSGRSPGRTRCLGSAGRGGGRGDLLPRR